MLQNYLGNWEYFWSASTDYNQIVTIFNSRWKDNKEPFKSRGATTLPCSCCPLVLTSPTFSPAPECPSTR